MAKTCDGRGDDCDELWTLEGRHTSAAERLGIEGGHEFFAGKRPFDINLQRGGFTDGQPVQRAGNGARNSRAHEHAGHAREHGPEQRRQSGELDFFQQIDAHQSIMPFFGEEHLDEGSENNRLHKARTELQRGFRNEAKGRTLGFAAFNEIIRQHARDHVGQRKMCQRPANRAIEITQLQPARENRLDARS